MRKRALRFCRSLALSRSSAVRRPADPADLSDLDFWLKGAHVVKVEFENKLAIFVAALAGLRLLVASGCCASGRLEVNPVVCKGRGPRFACAGRVPGKVVGLKEMDAEKVTSLPPVPFAQPHHFCGLAVGSMD